jgi:N-acetylglucosaminyl-diphospho-decaprenol L-rhamnosyltransferase
VGKVDLSIVIVNWNVCELLRRCLASLRRGRAQLSPGLNMEVIVVDCASSDGSPDMVGREFPWVRLLASDRNLGYAGGTNLGTAEARGRYLLMLNPDTEVPGEALGTMLSYLDEHAGVGAVGPQLRYPDGSLQSSRRRFPTLATAFLESSLLQQWFPDNAVARRYYVADRPSDQAQAVDWLVGAAWMVRREAWQQAGPLDEGFFMYFEELDWCRRCHMAGWEVHYVPAAQVVHHEGKSSQQVVAARTIRFQRSKLRYFEKYYGPGWAQAIRLFLLGTFALQLAEESFKWLVGRNQDLHRQRMAAYWQVLRSGLRAPGA